MKRFPKLSLLAGLALAAAGCNTDAIVADSLAANDPARLDAPAGPPPVAVELLTIAPTGLPATATPAIAPDPVMPKMDADFRDRSFPEGTGSTLPPATRAADLADVPYANPAFGQPATREGGRP